jgi:hypothetical protein
MLLSHQLSSEKNILQITSQHRDNSQEGDQMYGEQVVTTIQAIAIHRDSATTVGIEDVETHIFLPPTGGLRDSCFTVCCTCTVQGNYLLRFCQSSSYAATIQFIIIHSFIVNSILNHIEYLGIDYLSHNDYLRLCTDAVFFGLRWTTLLFQPRLIER